MGYPDGAQAQYIRENIVGQRAAKIRQYGRLFSAGSRYRCDNPPHPGILRIDTRSLEHDFPIRYDAHHGKALPIQVAAQSRQDVVKVDYKEEAQLETCPRSEEKTSELQAIMSNSK